MSELSNCRYAKMSDYYKNFLKPRQANNNPLSFNFYKKNYALLPLVGIVATSVVAVAFVSVHQYSNTDVRTKQEKKQEDVSSADEKPRRKAMESIKQTFKSNSELRSLYLDMAKAEYLARNVTKETEASEGA